MPEPGDETAAGPARHGHLRTARADREHVIGVLQAAFVHGMLNRDDLDLRVGRALTARTYADLAAVTADLPAPPAGPPRRPAPARGAGRAPANGGVKAAICTAVAAIMLAAALVTGRALFALVAVCYLMGLLAAGAEVISARRARRARGRRASPR